MAALRAVNYRTYLRSGIALALTIVWSLVTVSGVLLWLAPRVRIAWTR
jgi:hypothetical protein